MIFTNDKWAGKVLLFVVMFPAFAAAANTDMLKGFYVGANVAATSTNISNDLRFNSQDIDDADLYFRNQYGSHTQVQPGVVVGYEYIYANRWLVSAEVQANFIKSFINMGATDYVSNIIGANNQYAVQARVGYNFTENDNTLYALIGGVRTNQTVKIIFDNTNLTVGALGDLQLSSVNASRQVNGLKLGVGYEKHVSDRLGLRVDYSHITYDNYKISLYDSTFAPILGASGTSNLSQATEMLVVTLLLFG